MFQMVTTRGKEDHEVMKDCKDRSDLASGCATFIRPAGPITFIGLAIAAACMQPMQKSNLKKHMISSH